jgi:hypothetical protein
MPRLRLLTFTIRKTRACQAHSQKSPLVKSFRMPAKTFFLTSKAQESNIVDIDEALEVAKPTESSIRHQSIVAMMAQANSVRASILKESGCNRYRFTN